MSALGKRKPAGTGTSRPTRRKPEPEPEPESASEEEALPEESSGHEDEDVSSGEDDEAPLSDEEDASEDDDEDPSDSMEDASEGDSDGEGSDELDELDDDAFEGDDLELDEYGAADDDSDGAGDDDDFAHDSDADDSDDDGRATAAAGAASRAEGGGGGGNAFGFARAFTNLVGEADGAPAGEVLPKTKKQRRQEAEQRREKRARSLDKKHRLELRERGHVVPKRGVADPESDRRERRLTQTATRGVVRLFNAVSQAQRAAADAGKSRLGGKSKQLTKSKFLAELKKSTAGEREGVVAGGGAAEEKKGSASGGGWDVLSDGYLMGRNKLKDWDKGTKEAETEVEYEDEDLE